MNIGRMALAAMLTAAMLTAGQAARAERVPVCLYAAEDSIERGAAQDIVALLSQTFPQGDFTLAYETQAGSLRDLVMADRAPQLALCAPQEARMWAAEGMLAPLEAQTAELERIQPEVAEACMFEERLFMTPLSACHRRMAVNARLLHETGLGALLDEGERTVWYPQQLNLVLEEFGIRGMPAMDVWLPEEDGAALEALVQAIYGGMLLPGEEEARWPGLLAGVSWLREMTACGYVRVASGREEALGAFLDGETALFIDWRDGDEARCARQLQSGAVELAVIPYPSSCGVPVRAWRLTGAAVFLSDDPRQTALALEAAAFLSGDAAAQRLLGGRDIRADGAVWLRDPGAAPQGATLRSLFDQALCAALAGGGEADAADAALLAALRVLP